MRESQLRGRGPARARRTSGDPIGRAYDGESDGRSAAPFGWRSRRLLIPVVAAALVAGAAAACSAPLLRSPLDQGAAATPTPRLELPSPVPEPNVLVVCLAQEPDSFYPYGPRNRSAQALLPLLYDGPIDVLDYVPQAVILDGLPSVEDGSVRLEPVSLRTGDLYFNPVTRLPEELRAGKTYLPSGCTDLDCQRTYQGGGAEMDQMVVEFRLLEDLQWSDGTALAASDSVFAYRLDADPDTPSIKDQVNRTSSYEAVDARTVRWTGIPGFLDAEFTADFWSPLPEHLLGETAPADLPQDEAARRSPIGWGPYRLETWDAGKSMVFVPNPTYERWPEGAPGYDQVLVRFIAERGDGALQQLITGECDVLEEELVGLDSLPSLRSLADQGRLRWEAVPGPIVERIDFDTDPADDRAPILADPAVRRALAMCVDRQALIQDLAGVGSPVPVAYLPGNHPMASGDLQGPSFDPAAAAQALQAEGWIDDDGDPATPRRAQGVARVPAGAPLELALLTSDDEFQQGLADAIARDLTACGAEVAVEAQSADGLYGVWPDGPAFGRRFDLVLWPWLQWIVPECDSFTSAEVPSAENPQGSNASGFSEAAFDAACAQAAMGPITGDRYAESVRETERIFIEHVPAVSILSRPRLIAFARGVCGPQADPTASSWLWNVEAWFSAETCP